MTKDQYEATKAYLKKNSHFINFEGLERFYDELLEYRRQNNIFEVGDYVIGLSTDEFGDDVVRITRLFELSGVYCFECEAVDYTGDDEISLVKHATYAEIEAGRRL